MTRMTKRVIMTARSSEINGADFLKCHIRNVDWMLLLSLSISCIVTAHSERRSLPSSFIRIPNISGMDSCSNCLTNKCTGLLSLYVLLKNGVAWNRNSLFLPKYSVFPKTEAWHRFKMTPDPKKKKKDTSLKWDWMLSMDGELHPRCGKSKRLAVNPPVGLSFLDQRKQTGAGSSWSQTPDPDTVLPSIKKHPWLFYWYTVTTWRKELAQMSELDQWIGRKSKKKKHWVMACRLV